MAKLGAHHILTVPFLLACFVILQPGHCVVEESIPESGSTVVGGEGESVTFYCRVLNEANGTQVATEWFIQEIGDNSPQTIVRTQSNFNITGEPLPNPVVPGQTYQTNLTILSLTSDLDRATLSCGEGGTPPDIDASFILRIYRPPDLNDGFERTVIENDTTEIDVSGSGGEPFPFPQQFQWMKDGVNVTNSSRISYGYPTVVFQYVLREDIGNYTLSATNFRLDNESLQVGNDTGSFLLDVFFAPNITLGPSIAAAVSGDNVTLICGTNVTGNPEPTIQWIDNNNTAVNRSDSRFVFVDGPEIVSLMVYNVTEEDEGVWRCIVQVENITDADIEHNITLTVVVPPSEPRNVSVDNIGTTWVILSWERPEFLGSPPTTTYRIIATDSLDSSVSTVQTVNESVVQIANDTDNVTELITANVTELLPGTEYSFVVAAISSVQSTELVMAEGLQSVAVFGTTNVTVPAPLCSNIPTSEGGVINVTWSYIHTGGLNLTEVVVEYSESGDFQDLQNGNLTDLSQTSLEVLNFTAGQTYSFQVTASNQMGSSSVLCPAVNHSVGIPQIPAMPSGVSNGRPGSVTLTLSTEEAGTATSTEFFQFIVRAEQVSNGSVSYHLKPIEDYMDRQEVNVVVNGLVGDERYRFRASASNSFGNSNFSDESSEIRIVVAPPTTPPPTSRPPADVGAIVGGVIGSLIIGAVLLILLVLLVLLLVYCFVIKPRRGKSVHFKDQEDGSNELTDNQAYVTNEKVAPQNKETEFPNYEAIGEEKVGASNESLYDSLAPHPKHTDNPLYSTMGGVTAQIESSPPTVPEKRDLSGDKGSPRDSPINEDTVKNEPVYSEAILEPHEKESTPQPQEQATENTYTIPGPPTVSSSGENAQKENGSDLGGESEVTML